MANLNTIGGIHYEMMRRCYNPKSVVYKDFGAKGITVCEEWHDREVFKQWCKDNGYQKGMRIDRKDSTKGYCPENCYLGYSNVKKSNHNRDMREMAVKRKKDKKNAYIEGRIQDNPLYSTYNGMHTRCENKNHSNYQNYGGRGISVCEEWSGECGFLNFHKWAIENGWKKGLTIDRKDNDKGYSPDNCRWEDKHAQSENRRSNVIIVYNGKEMTLSQIAREENIKYGMLYNRYRLKGIDIYKAVKDLKEE